MSKNTQKTTALYNFEAEDYTELGVEKGDEVIINDFFQDELDGWTYCTSSKGKSGYIPTSYLKRIPNQIQVSLEKKKYIRTEEDRFKAQDSFFSPYFITAISIGQNFYFLSYDDTFFVFDPVRRIQSFKNYLLIKGEKQIKKIIFFRSRDNVDEFIGYFRSRIVLFKVYFKNNEIVIDHLVNSELSKCWYGYNCSFCVVSTIEEKQIIFLQGGSAKSSRNLVLFTPSSSSSPQIEKILIPLAINFINYFIFSVEYNLSTKEIVLGMFLHDSVFLRLIKVDENGKPIRLKSSAPLKTMHLNEFVHTNIPIKLKSPVLNTAFGKSISMKTIQKKSLCIITYVSQAPKLRRFSFIVFDLRKRKILKEIQMLEESHIHSSHFEIISDRILWEYQNKVFYQETPIRLTLYDFEDQKHFLFKIPDDFKRVGFPLVGVDFFPGYFVSFDVYPKQHRLNGMKRVVIWKDVGNIDLSLFWERIEYLKDPVNYSLYLNVFVIKISSFCEIFFPKRFLFL